MWQWLPLRVVHRLPTRVLHQCKLIRWQLGPSSMGDTGEMFCTHSSSYILILILPPASFLISLSLKLAFCSNICLNGVWGLFWCRQRTLQAFTVVEIKMKSNFEERFWSGPRVLCTHCAQCTIFLLTSEYWWIEMSTRWQLDPLSRCYHLYLSTNQFPQTT